MSNAGAGPLRAQPGRRREGRWVGELTAHQAQSTLSKLRGERMAEVDPIQALRDLTHKRFVELATEMQPKSRRALKELFDGVISQLAALRDAAEDRKHK